jgi:lipoate-protein ligase A
MNLHWISLRNVSIFEQLKLEEALLRTEDRNFCIVNRGSPKAIVMGISGDAEKMLHIPLVKQDLVPVIRRFSGGGTVVVDEDTLFITWIFSKKDSPTAPFPEPMLRWSAEVYAEAWKIPGFALRENDYVIGNTKCGGNAQYIQKDRWLHHTSFLWDYKKENMEYLQLPAKRPQYRLDRDHSEFVCKLKTFLPNTIDQLEEILRASLVKRFYIQSLDVSSLQFREHRQTVRMC